MASLWLIQEEQARKFREEQEQAMTTPQRVGPCISCGKSVPDVDFYSKGRKCKLCVCAASIAWRAANPERVKATRKAYRESLSYEKKRAMNRESSVRNRELRTEKQRQWRARNEDKKQAWVTVEKAIARGELVRPDTCQECGRHKDEMQIQASHHDYSKPLDVEWLCVKCHRAKDSAMREEVVQLKDKIAALLQQLAELQGACAELTKREAAQFSDAAAWKATARAMSAGRDAAEAKLAERDAAYVRLYEMKNDYCERFETAERAREEAEQDRWRTDWPEMKPLIDSPPSIWRSERVIVSLVGGMVTHDVAESFDGKRPLWFIHRDKVRAWQPFPAAFLAANGGGRED